MKFMGTTQGLPEKGIIFGKKLSGKFSNAFLRTGVILWNQISPDLRVYLNQSLSKSTRGFLFETFSDRDDYVEVDTP